MAEKIDLDLDPKKVIEALEEMSKQSKKLSQDIEESLGKKAAKNIQDLEEQAEKSTSKVSTYFKNLGTRVKEDLKTAFNIGAIGGGLKLAQDLASGTKQVFEMERAFDRLNTRLGFTGQKLQDFKKNIGQAISSRGQKLEEILPGVELASSKGGIKSTEQLTAVGDLLAQAKGVTGENTEALSDAVIEILKSQGKEVTAQSFKQTLDAIQGTRVAGAFGTAGEAGAQISAISPYAKQLGLDTRQLGGLVATASKAGVGGEDALKQLIEQASTVEGRNKLNSVFGKDIFDKSGKINAKALGQVDTNRFGAYTPQILESATGIQGHSGQDIIRLVEAFKNGLDSFDKVAKGSDETSNQFQIATDNLASKIDRFKERLKEGGREIASGVTNLGNDILKGDFNKAKDDAVELGKTAYENKGAIGATLGASAVAAVLAGGAANKLLSKVGAGGLVGGALKGELAKQAGIQPVYVTNASEIGGGTSAIDSISKYGKYALGIPALTTSLGVGAAGAAGYGIGSLVNEIPGVSDAIQNLFEKILGDPDKKFKESEAYQKFIDYDKLAQSVAKGTAEANARSKDSSRVIFTNPSQVSGRGGGL